ncbi:MAG: hypothetical protein JOY99_01600 [Sphingomonadaceae bacterium]|nr:hypothetical protein [Sphingomonadaceae bacterium]
MATYDDARAVLGAWKLDTGALPFGDANSHDAGDRARQLLTQASCLLSMMGAACSDARALTGAGKGSEFHARNSETMARAFDGIGSLVDLANFLLED